LHSASFTLKSLEGPFINEALLHIRRSSSLEELRGLARSEVAFCASLVGEQTREAVVFDDGGNEIERLAYNTTLGDSVALPFRVFHAGGIPCGLSFENGLLSPDTGRALALAGVGVVCCFPSEEALRSYPLADFARVRAIENGFFVLLVLPNRDCILCVEPRKSQDQASFFVESGHHYELMLERARYRGSGPSFSFSSFISCGVR